MTGQTAAFSKAVLAGAIGAMALGFGVSAQAAGRESLREGLFGGRPMDGREASAPAVARYVSEDGDGFVLDRSQTGPLLKFDNSPEVWALAPHVAPRGDTIYKNDLGEPVLRATRLGGVTLFTDERPGGSAAALEGTGPALRLSPLGPQALLERLSAASARASHAARRLITFDAEATPASSAVIADAAMVASEAVIRMTRRLDARRLISHVGRVKLVEGRKSAVQFDAGAMRITVAPDQGVAGRPSSERIVAAAAALH